MGFKKTAVGVMTIALLLTPLSVHAESVDKLYEKYDMDYEVYIPQDVSETIKNYNAAQRYVKMYHYVASAIYDKDAVKAELAEARKQLAEVEMQLRNGYSLTLSEIYELEDTYTELKHDEERLQSALIEYEPDWGSEVAENVPDYAGYTEAKKTRDAIIASQEIGNITSPDIPVASQALLYDDSDTMTIYKTIPNATVLAMFNGKVEDIKSTDDYGLTVKVNCSNGVNYYICNLESTDVKKGDTVYQGQNIGNIVDTKAVFRLQLDGTFVNVSKLYSKE